MLNKRGLLKQIAGLMLILIVAIVVIAFNESSPDNVENQSFDSINVAIQNPSYNENQSLNTSMDFVAAPPDENKLIEIDNDIIPEKRLVDIVAEHKTKLNYLTENHLSSSEEDKENIYLIKFKSGIKTDKLSDFSLEKEYAKFGMVTINGKAENLGELLEDSDVTYIELDQNIEALSDAIPYGVNKTNAPDIWNLTNGNGVKVAVLDTGISSHSDLSIAGGISFVSDDYQDEHGHGTMVAGVLSALDNDYGLIGVLPSVDLYAVKIMNSSVGSLSDAISAIEWCIDNNISIVSMSFGMESYSQIFKEVLEEAYSNGILLVAAAGNNNGEVLYPAAYDSVIAAGAVDSSDERASFSAHGFELELVAAGVDINSTYLNNGYNIDSGTSFAAPHVAGVAALIKSFNNSLSNEQIRAKLRNDALDLGDLGKDDYYGYGLARVNLSSYDYAMQNYTHNISSSTSGILTRKEFCDKVKLQLEGTNRSMPDFCDGEIYILSGGCGSTYTKDAEDYWLLDNYGELLWNDEDAFHDEDSGTWERISLDYNEEFFMSALSKKIAFNMAL